ncbi:MAG: sodium:proton antiporter [Planctomycetota bacterium]
MGEHLALGLACILILGVGAQWLAWRVGIPAILFLLAAGILAGPVAGFIDPDQLFGNALAGIVSISVALILFEGGLSLHLDEIHTLKKTLTRLVSLGAVVSWLGAAVAAYFLLGFTPGVSLLLGATLVVTGPTVIIPLLRLVRPSPKASALLKWEGIVIDPIGATLALLVFEALVATGRQEALLAAAKGIGMTLLVGLSLGAIGAALIYVLMRRYWMPDYLQIPVILASVVGLFALSEELQHESGFLTVTAMGALLGNQKQVAIGHIVEFKENLRVLLIASLFIILSARLDLGLMAALGWPVLAFIAVLIVIVRPLSVMISTRGSALSTQEKAFVSLVAPRGVVAAAVSSVFALELERLGYKDAPQFVAVTFAVIIGTVLFYGLTALPISRLLGVGNPNPQGFLILGCHSWARGLAGKLKEAGFRVLLASTNRVDVHRARLDGLDAWYGNALSESAAEEMNLDGIGRLLSTTTNTEVNKLAASHFGEIFGRSEAYRITGGKTPDDDTRMHDTRGRVAFEKDMTHEYFSRRFLTGSEFRLTRLSDSFSYADFVENTRGTARLLFVIRKKSDLIIFTEDNPLEPKAGDSIITLSDRDQKVVS